MKYCLLLLILTGCSSITGTREMPDGSKLSIRSRRWFWNSQAVTFQATDTNGIVVKITIGSSKSDSESIRSVSEGIAQGVVQGMKSGL